MGKTAVFVLAVLQQIEAKPNEASTLVLCHIRELAYQICHEFDRFKKYMPNISTGVFYGGVPVQQHRTQLAKETPNIIIGTPGRILQLANEKALKLGNIKHFVLDECDKLLDSLGLDFFFFFFQRSESISTNFFHLRHEKGCAKDFQNDPAQQASHDVLSHLA